MLFVLYSADIAALVQKCGLVPHLYADDAHIYGWSLLVHIGDLLEKFAGCFDDISGWMWSNHLQLNVGNIEFLWCTTARRQHHLLRANIAVSSHQVTHSTSAHDPRIFIDTDLVMRSLLRRTVSRSFAMQRQL